ncbi:hypothetical protein M413DRAFT_30557 [Hebeloma cylindrosporum]|uniref:Methyltransferase domain-containing protein n=1 Tax=Hebeloma cylindrosporum TaxID=76867 RepID=A0A0C3BMI0_HEBCY|nr:hypothetical protein M413DRAFT_30557 [Hebeloma cylindrosporum h7]
MSLRNGHYSTGLPHANGNNSNGPHVTDSPTPGNGSEEYASDSPDETSSMEELAPEEFPSYFSERDNHLFHSSSSPYPLPVDGPEQHVLPAVYYRKCRAPKPLFSQRLNTNHDLLLQFYGAHYVGPVPDVLVQSERPRMALDICTGTGKWVMDMAQEFPGVHFQGFDIVPIQTRYPLPNVQFEIHDVNTNFRWQDATFDLINARDINMAVRDFRQVVEEVARVLRPGGLLISYEWSPYPAFHPSLDRDPSIHAPASCRLAEAVRGAFLSTRGLHLLATEVPSILVNTGLFADVSPNQHHIPVGAWHADPSLRRIGTMCREAQEQYADSIKPLLLEAGWEEADASRILADYIQEIRTVGGLVIVLHTVHARKV